MQRYCSVNQALGQLAEAEERAMTIEGILQLQPEGYQLLHYPKAERLTVADGSNEPYQAAVWVGFGSGSLQPNSIALTRWEGKRVRIQGFVRTIASLPSFAGLGRGGFGPHGLWPIQIEPYSVQRVTADERREDFA